MCELPSLAFRQNEEKPGIKLGTFFKPDPAENDFAFLKNTGVERVSVWTGVQDNNYECMLRTRLRMP